MCRTPSHVIYFHAAGCAVTLLQHHHRQARDALCFDATMATSLGNREFQLHYNLMGPLSSLQTVPDGNGVKTMTVQADLKDLESSVPE